MGVTTVISLRLSNDLLERINATGVNRNSFIKEAIEEKLNPVKMPDLTRAEEKAVIKGTKNMTELMKDAILQRFQQERDLLSDMPKDAFAQMVMRLLPKETVDDGDLGADVLSLQKCIDALPKMEDITEELNRVKLEYARVSAKWKTAQKLLNHVQHKETFAELMDGIYRYLVEYVVEMVSRNALPGMGEGGGLKASGYVAIAERVKLDLEKLRVTGKVGSW